LFSKLRGVLPQVATTGSVYAGTALHTRRVALSKGAVSRGRGKRAVENAAQSVSFTNSDSFPLALHPVIGNAWLPGWKAVSQ
jgi:hypothetical protein